MQKPCNGLKAIESTFDFALDPTDNQFEVITGLKGFQSMSLLLLTVLGAYILTLLTLA